VRSWTYSARKYIARSLVAVDTIAFAIHDTTGCQGRLAIVFIII